MSGTTFAALMIVNVVVALAIGFSSGGGDR